MKTTIQQLHIWHGKDQIIRQVEIIAESDDWYRGGRKIGRLKRELSKMDEMSPPFEKLFEERVETAHQTYMDRLSLHKLKGPRNQRSLKEAEISRNKAQSALFLASIAQAEKIIAHFQQNLSLCNEQTREELDLEMTMQIIDRMKREMAEKKNKIHMNKAVVEVLESPDGFVGCSGTIRTVQISKTQPLH
ncbi:MAG: hypothetical protein HQL52_05775 [Magnetococcales bacterium]|nr:hypothetical protein [Magnetococcales bacterium]